MRNRLWRSMHKVLSDWAGFETTSRCVVSKARRPHAHAISVIDSGCSAVFLNPHRDVRAQRASRSMTLQAPRSMPHGDPRLGVEDLATFEDRRELAARLSTSQQMTTAWHPNVVIVAPTPPPSPPPWPQHKPAVLHKLRPGDIFFESHILTSNFGHSFKLVGSRLCEVKRGVAAGAAASPYCVGLKKSPSHRRQSFLRHQTCTKRTPTFARTGARRRTTAALHGASTCRLARARPRL